MNRFNRRKAMLLALACGAALLAPALHAQTSYPDRPVRFLVPYPPGGGTDVIARIVQQRFQAALGQPIVIENKGGAGGAIIENCDFVTSSAKEALSAITIPTTFDDWKIRRCRFIQPTDPAGANAGAGTGAIYIVDSENVEIEDCEFRGNWETAFIHNKTTGCANLWVRRCYGICSLADAQPFLLVSTATGGADRCSFITPAETATTEATLSGTFPAGFFNFQSYFGNDGGGGQLAIASQAAAS